MWTDSDYGLPTQKKISIEFNETYFQGSELPVNLHLLSFHKKSRESMFLLEFNLQLSNKNIVENVETFLWKDNVSFGLSDDMLHLYSKYSFHIM